MAYSLLRTFNENDGVMSYTGDPDGAAYVHAKIYEQVNASANTSDIRLEVIFRNTDAFHSEDSNVPYTAHIAGQSYSGSTSFDEGAEGTEETVLSITKTGIAHNADGSKSINIDFFLDTGTNAYGDVTLPSTSVILTTIPRKSILNSVPDFIVEDGVTVSYTNYTPYTKTLYVKIDGNTIKTISPFSSGTRVEFTDTQLLAVYNSRAYNDFDTTIVFELYTATVGDSDTDSAVGYMRGFLRKEVNGSIKRCIPLIGVGGGIKKCIPYIGVNGVVKRGIY